MEKLKQAKHNHLLTDWLKVGIFALLLLLPFFVFAPTAFYYGFNEHATAPTKQVENTTTINMQQNVINGLPTSMNGFNYDQYNTYFSNNKIITFIQYDTSLTLEEFKPMSVNTNDKLLVSFYTYNETANTQITYFLSLNDDSYNSEEITITTTLEATKYSSIFIYDDTTLVDNEYTYINWQIKDNEIQSQDNFNYLYNFQLFNLTQMFGSGNEPTIEEFNTLFPNDYYAVDSDATAEWPNGTYTTYTDISSTMSFAWESMFDTPLLKWTKDSPFKTSINGFLTIFQIPQQSGIGLYLNYLITMVCIYVVFDIVIQLFKWITHIIGEK